MLAFTLRSLWRELASGELRVLLLGLIIGVGAFTSVALFNERVHQAMTHQAGELLAADLLIQSSSPLPEAWKQSALGMGLQLAETISFRSMTLAGERLQMAEVKAVSRGYPLRGRLLVAETSGHLEQQRQTPPQSGSVWLERQLLDRLGLKPGDDLQLGESGFRISGLIIEEPDRGGSLFNIAPRLMMNPVDLPATGLLTVGSRAEYRLLLAGEADVLEAFRGWIKPRLQAGQRLLGPRDSRRELTSALERAERFLGLASLVSLLLAAVAIAMAANRYARRHLDNAALLRCLGASRQLITRIFTGQLLLLGLAGSLIGLLFGYLVQHLLAALLAGLFIQQLPPPTLQPLLLGLLIGLVTLTGFALPPLLALRNTPPLRVLRREMPLPRISRLAIYGPALAVLTGLLAWQADDWQLTLLVSLGLLATLSLLALVAWLMTRMLQHVSLSGGQPWRLGLANIARHPEVSIIQLVAVGLGMMVILLLILIRTDLLDAWRATLPFEAPNHFLINVQADQLAPLEKFFRQQKQPAPVIYPMVRGRLHSLNGTPVEAESYSQPRAKQLIQREFNLSWMERMPTTNRLVSGHWWSRTDERGWSVEKGIARTLGIQLGDRLTFEIAGQTVSAPVTSLRTVAWDSFEVNFFVIAPPGQLDLTQASYITAFFLPPGKELFRARLIEHFPNITDIDVGALMLRIRSIIDRVILSVQFVSLFTLLAGLVVLLAAVQSSLDERIREAAILRTLGAMKRQIRTAIVTEFMVLGAIAGLLAALGASLIAALLADQLFGLSYQGNLWIWPGSLLSGMLLMGASGVLGVRSVLQKPPLQQIL